MDGHNIQRSVIKLAVNKLRIVKGTSTVHKPKDVSRNSRHCRQVTIWAAPGDAGGKVRI